MTTKAQQFLDAAYSDLDFSSGDLVGADTSPSSDAWIDKGDWIELTKSVGADKIFFINGNPVIVFAKQDTDDPEKHRQLLKNIWCMSRPNLLFLATPGELAVYDLTKPPYRTPYEWKNRKPLAIVKEAAKVASELNNYHRAQVESGRLFEEFRFGSPKQRADLTLIQDLRTVRKRLMEAGLSGDKIKYAHALIGRSIFIRYLEDRGILTEEYFFKVAGKNKAWRSILKSVPDTPFIDEGMASLCYPRVLSDQYFTYALFGQLAHDFNGDMFPRDDREREVVKQKHLGLLQGLLRGDTTPQRPLFFWAYKFNIVPIELISSIYEEFYQTQNGAKEGAGTHYSPSALVEFLCNQVLTPERLAQDPVVLDMACGSGIFLVEAFRRIVRYKVHQQNGRRLNAIQLRKILQAQIRGIEINEEAVKIAAFSLSLALLHYQKPPDILAQVERGYRLPCLIKSDENIKVSEKFDILKVANAFDPEIDGSKADIIIGNPPWGDAPPKDSQARCQAQRALDWCNEQGYPVGDRERSQTFIWRAIDLLEDGGVAGLLVSTGIFFKHHRNSRNFREKFLECIKVQQVINFAHVRKIFFSKSVAPFASIIFEKSEPAPNHRFLYASAKKTALANSLQSVILARPDMTYFEQSSIKNNDIAWKIFWWGNHHDLNLINNLRMNGSLGSIVNDNISGRGYEKVESSGSRVDSDWLKDFKELAVKKFHRYGKLNLDTLREVPNKVYRRGTRGAYSGNRLLVKRGISENIIPKGQIIARYEKKPFCFTNAILGIHICDPKDFTYKLILGILWSSFARYYYFFTSSNWGMWRDALYNEEILSIPMPNWKLPILQSKVVEIVDQLRRLEDTYSSRGLLTSQHLPELEKQLDDAVFDLYELNEAERDLILDLCNVGLPFFYNSYQSKAAQPLPLSTSIIKQGRIVNLSDDQQNRLDINGYLLAFIKIWNRELNADEEFEWRIISSLSSPILALIFTTRFKENPPASLEESDEQAWETLLEKFSVDLRAPFSSRDIYTEKTIRIVTRNEIIIVKSNEARLWTRSMARIDAEATLLQAMNLDSSRCEAAK